VLCLLQDGLLCASLPKTSLSLQFKPVTQLEPVQVDVQFEPIKGKKLKEKPKKAKKLKFREPENEDGGFQAGHQMLISP